MEVFVSFNLNPEPLEQSIQVSHLWGGLEVGVKIVEIAIGIYGEDL